MFQASKHSLMLEQFCLLLLLSFFMYKAVFRSFILSAKARIECLCSPYILGLNNTINISRPGCGLKAHIVNNNYICLKKVYHVRKEIWKQRPTILFTLVPNYTSQTIATLSGQITHLNVQAMNWSDSVRNFSSSSFPKLFLLYSGSGLHISSITL